MQLMMDLYLCKIKKKTELYDPDVGMVFLSVSFVGASGLASALIARNVTLKEEELIVTQILPSPFDRKNRIARDYQDAMKSIYPDGFFFRFNSLFLFLNFTHYFFK